MAGKSFASRLLTWKLSLIGCVIFAIAFGPQETFPVFQLAMSDHFGWSRASTNGVYSVTLIVATIAGPLIGAFIDRSGPRRAIILGTGLFLGCMVASSQITTLWHYYVVFGVGMALSLPMIITAVSVTISNQYPDHRGTALGIVYTGIALGAMIMVPLIQAIIERTDWRVAYLILAGLLVALFPLARLLPSATTAAGETPAQNAPRANGSILRQRAFWGMLIACVATSTIDFAMFQHTMPLIVTKGHSDGMAASMLAMISLGYLVGQLLGGILSDRLGRALMASIGGIMVALSVGGLTRFMHLPLLTTLAMVGGIGVGIIINTRSATMGDLFAGANLGKLMGLIQIGSAVGASFITWFGGFEFDRTHRYDQTFLIVIGATVVWVILIWLLAPRRPQSTAHAVQHEGEGYQHEYS